MAPLAARAQSQAKVPRIGVLAIPSFESPEMQFILNAFREGLRAHGYVEGQNIVVEVRSAGGDANQLRRFANELVRLDVALVVVGTGRVARAMRQASGTIPIVATVMSDPVDEGLAVSLARPGGNVTGLSTLSPELVAKRLELI